MKTDLYPPRKITLGSPRYVSRLLGSSIIAAALLAASPVLAQKVPIITGASGWLFPGWESLKDFDQNGINSSADLISDASKALAARDIRLITIIAPLKARFHGDKLPENVQMSEAVMKQYDFIIDALKSRGVATVDLRPAISSVQQGKQTAFYRADYHWTAWSSEAAADAVAASIKDSGIKLAGAAGSGDKLGEWMTQRHYGDLAERFLSPDDKKKVGPELFTVRAAAAGQGNSLLGQEGPAPVHVVGNSFVQPYLGFPQKLSNDLDRQVSLTWNPGNVGPWVSFLQYVESPAFQKNPPQFVVWFFNEGAFHSTPDNVEQWDSSSLMSPQQWRSRLDAALRR